MRLKRLDLTRYGHFTDRVVDFGAAEAGRPDFHVIHGPNEAGKSTLFSAWLDFLYGMPVQSPYNFLHDYKTMRIGATLETASGARRLARIKKPAASLLDDNDQPTADTVLMGDLGGLDRDAYRTMFSLDEMSLEQGGEAILASKGDLGQLLFSASAGLSDLSRRLDGIRAETDDFHKHRAQKTALADLKRRLDELKAERDAIDVAAADHARLVAERDSAKSVHEETNRRRAELRVRLDRATRHLAALPQLARRESLRQELAGLECPPPPPSHWAEDIPAIRRRAVELATGIERLERDIAHIGESLADRPDRDPVLDRQEEIESLAALAGRAMSEEDDLPNRFAERERADRLVADILRRLGQGDTAEPRALLLPARTLGALKGLIAEHSGVMQRFDSARREVKTAEDALSDLRASLAQELGAAANADPAAFASLAERLAAVRAVDHAERLARASQALENARKQLNRRLPPLRPWSGEPQALGQLAAPAASVITDIGKRLAEAEAAGARSRTELDSLQAELAALEAERQAVAGIPGLVTDNAARDSRATREAAWARHRETLAAETADLFRQALDADDRLGEQRLLQLGDVAKLRSLDQSLARIRARKSSAEQSHAGHIATETATRAELAALVASVSPALPADMSQAAFEAWCTALADAQEALDVLGRAENERAATGKALALAQARLREALAGCGQETGEEDGIEGIAERAQALLDARSRREAQQAAWRTRETELERRRAELVTAEHARATWDEAWLSACSGTWLSGQGRTPSVAEMSEILDALQKLDTELGTRDGIMDRIGKMERDIAAFAETVKGLAGDLGLSADMPPRQIYGLLAARLAGACKEESRRKDEMERLERLEAEHALLGGEKAALETRIGVMTAHFGVDSLEAVEEKLAVTARRSALEREIETLSRELVESLRAGTAAEMEAELAGADRAALENEIETLRPECDALDEETNRAYAAWAGAQQRLSGLGSDDAAARLAAARRTVLLEIEDGARRYLELRLGAIATDQALRLYRDRHRSSMMTRASDAFVQLTRGNYASLSTHRDGQRETLVAIGADGSSKEAGELSKGTQFQLYLALRVAGYQEYAATRRPVPFIADDIMESFDEERSAEALTQLSIMARSGQVIYLTHHQHICEIARAVCPTVTVHGL
jgi:uncharacterized protein YhaN